ncbi:WD40 repeat [Lentzea fradiae]|uniref:WD40 repeat n=1 Tax=Lentzea fradiae TaxID=200378 RepID=A0A1G7T638_9PSEU|nr:TIR domain-containing protein [Lentzea fradiae]SDG30504.1 WD40 repeat [Lentzea fradiae]
MGEPDYDAFISYSRALDGTLAPALQRGVQRFAKPWNRLRATRVFLDDASLSANPGLWTSIENALSRSRWLVLLASPEAAASEWVGRELDWWLEHKSAQSILVVLTSGEYAQSVPARVRKALGEEPRWVDLRQLRSASHVDDSNPLLRECVADVASAVRGVPKDDLVGEHVRQHRRTMRLARGAVTALAVLAVGVLVAALIAVVQRNDAVAQARAATARGLASAATANLRTDLALAQALAARAYRTEPGAQTRSALLASLTASPHLHRYVQVGGEVTALAASADGKVAVAGTADGRVVRLDLTASARSETRVGSDEVIAVATSADGGVVAAFTRGTAVRWEAASGDVQRFELPHSETFGLVAVSPSGRYSAFYSTYGDNPSGGEQPSTTIVHDGQKRDHVRREAKSLPLLVLRLPDDDTLLELSAGEWVRRSAATQEVVSTATGFVLPANGFWIGASADGSQFGWSTDGLTRVWRTDSPSFDYNSQNSEVRAGRPNPSHVAITDDGTRTAVADTGTIHVYDMTGAGELVRLEGNGETQFVEFLGSQDRLVSASRDRLVLWDLNRNTRLATTLPTRSPVSCNACPAPWLAVTNGKTAVAAGSDVAVGPEADSTSPDSEFGPIAWNAAGDGLHVVTLPEGIGETWETSPLRPGKRWKGDVVAEKLVALRANATDDRIVTVNEKGDVQVFTGPDLALERTITLDHPLEQAGWPPSGGLAAISADTSVVAVATADSVELVHTATGERRSMQGTADAVTFTDDHLVVQRSGTIEITNAEGTERRTVPTDPAYLPGIVASADTTLAAQVRRDYVAVITDLTTGEEVGHLPLVSQRGRFGRVGLAFDGPDRLVTAISGTRLVSWDLTEENWVRAACESADRTLTPDEWRRYVGTEPPDDLTCG